MCHWIAKFAWDISLNCFVELSVVNLPAARQVDALMHAVPFLRGIIKPFFQQQWNDRRAIVDVIYVLLLIDAVASSIPFCGHR